MEYSYLLSALPWGPMVFVIGVGCYALTLLRLRRRGASLRREEANLRNRLSDLNSART